MSAGVRIATNHAAEPFVLAKVEYFADVHLWPGRQVMDPQNWLKNFTPVERPYAVHLLNVFMYFSEPLIDAMLRAGFHSLSGEVVSASKSMAEARVTWKKFLDSLIVSYVEGEEPNPTDSGRTTFTRKARQVLEISQGKIMEPSVIAQRLSKESEGVVILLDDFVGSGSQMISSWHRLHPISGGLVASYQSLCSQGIRIIYIPLVATTHGLENINDSCAGLEVRPVHVLNEQCSLIHDSSVLWPKSLKSGCIDFLGTASERAGIVQPLHNWKGFDDLGLGLAFWHSVPDATLPLFHWDAAGWLPLVRRL